MIKYVYGIGIVLGLVFILLIVGAFWLNSSSPKYVWKKLTDQEMESSIVCNKNGETMLDIDSDKLLPLASTVKIMVAVDYAFQVAEEKLDRDEQIDVSELDKYYVKNLDGGAHEAWLEFIEDRDMVRDEHVSLHEVAKGMITFSSNANTEFLMKRLGIHNIEKRMEELDVHDHSSLFYFTSALFIPYELQQTNFPDKSIEEVKESLIEMIKNMHEEERVAIAEEIHGKLSADPEYKQDAAITQWWDSDFDKLYSDTFIRSTTAEYAKMMQKINDEKFPERAQEEVEDLLGSIMESEANQEWLKRAGKKGGSTRYILTDALFVEDRNGDKYEMAIFFHDLAWYESFKIMKSLNEFELNVLSDEDFRTELVK